MTTQYLYTPEEQAMIYQGSYSIGDMIILAALEVPYSDAVIS